RLVEPNAPPSSERFAALARLADAGLFTGITLMPVLPFIEDSDENIRAIVRKAAKSGVRAIYPAFGMTLRDRQRAHYFAALDRLFPEERLAERYRKQYGDYYECRSPRVKALWRVFTEECEKTGIVYEMWEIVRAYRLGYGSRQMTFF
ncbi:MAG: hypothetical protein NC084_12705, partial [Bacteroides sp.]|nr:hypothetical protein [Bacteroides sp.]